MRWKDKLKTRQETGADHYRKTTPKRPPERKGEDDEATKAPHGRPPELKGGKVRIREESF